MLSYVKGRVGFQYSFEMQAIIETVVNKMGLAFNILLKCSSSLYRLVCYPRYNLSIFF